jgi:hypothetical protein
MNKSTIIWIVGGIGTAVGGYFLYKRITRPTETFGEVDVPKKGGGSSSSTPTSTTNNDGLPLKRGSKGEKVKQLQRFLVAEGYNIGAFGILGNGVDGDFGRMTEKAVRENQQPFPTFKSMYPSAVEGQVSVDFFNSNIKGQY